MRLHRFFATASSLALLALAGCGGSSERPLELYDVLFEGDQFIAVGTKAVVPDEGGFEIPYGVIITSKDGSSWKEIEIDVDVPLWSVVHGSSRFVAVGGTFPPNADETVGAVLVSTDGKAWQRAETVPNIALGDVAHGNGRFVAVTFDDRVFKSADGLNWELIEDTGLEDGIHHVVFGNGVFVTYTDTTRIGVSTDGVHWTPLEIDPLFAVRGISFVDGVFLAGLQESCIEACDGPSPIARSTNGTDWTIVTDDLGPWLHDATLKDGVFVGTTAAALVRSTDGETWAPTSGVETRDWKAVAAGPSGFVSVGLGHVAHSADGAQWTETPVDVNVK